MNKNKSGTGSKNFVLKILYSAVRSLVVSKIVCLLPPAKHGLRKAPLDYYNALLAQHYINIPLFFNKEYMQQMAQRLALIKLMRKMEEAEKV